MAQDTRRRLYNVMITPIVLLRLAILLPLMAVMSIGNGAEWLFDVVHGAIPGWRRTR